VGIGPWQAIVDCGDRTLAVIGSRNQAQIDVNAGGAAARTDVLWADIDPDAGTWTGNIYAAGQEIGRLGVLLATINVPAGANTSAQMELYPGSSFGRRLLAVVARNTGGIQNANTWETALAGASTQAPNEGITVEPGQWYRVRYTAIAVVSESGSSLEGRIGVGYRPVGAPQASAAMGRGANISYRALGASRAAEVEWLFQPTLRQTVIFEGRIWAHISGTYRCGTGGGHGDYTVLTVEDLS
jgi:hypothetical protein